MGRKSSIWFRKQNATYYVNLDGKQINLGKDKAAAEKAFHKLKAADTPPTVGITAALLMDKFLAWTKEHKAASTFAWYTKHLQRFLDKLPQQTILASAVKPFHVYDAFGDWSSSYKRGLCIAVQRCFRWAEKQGYIDKTPLSNLEKPAAERREDYPTQAEFDAMVEQATEPFKSLLVFLGETGCRPQEAIAIKPEYIQGDRVVFPVKKSKGKKHARVIYLTDKAKIVLGNGFANKNGKPWTAFSINCRMRRIAEKTGKHFCAYQIRHMVITRWLEAKMDHITVAALAGHVNSTMISRVYQHLGQKNDYLLEALKRVS